MYSVKIKSSTCDEVKYLMDAPRIQPQPSLGNVRGSERERGGTLGRGCGWDNISSRAPHSLFSSHEGDTQHWWAESGVACLLLSPYLILHGSR